MRLLKLTFILSRFVTNFSGKKKNLLWLNQISSPISFPSDAKFIIPILVEVFVYVVV